MTVQARTPGLWSPTHPEHMEDFIERTLRERRPMQQALTDLSAKYRRLPPNNERSALERMIEGLKPEIAFRSTAAQTNE